MVIDEIYFLLGSILEKSTPHLQLDAQPPLLGETAR
jgi:hypothetical protein